MLPCPLALPSGGRRVGFLKLCVAIQSNILHFRRKCHLLGVFKFNLDFNELCKHSYTYPKLGTLHLFAYVEYNNK